MSVDDFTPPGDPRRPEDHGPRTDAATATARIATGKAGETGRAWAWGAAVLAILVLAVIFVTTG
ncbi:MAG TPA: hypothetical protein VD995_09405 [Azospirillum sp.]|nr:hypothetical protein [Azospirillum sp.]